VEQERDVDGVLSTLAVVGLFLLVAAVIVGTVVIVRRGGREVGTCAARFFTAAATRV